MIADLLAEEFGREEEVPDGDGVWVWRWYDFPFTILVCLASVAALVGAMPPQGLYGTLKIVAPIGLFIASALSPWHLPARAAAAVIFASFAAYNLGSMLVGRTDCGCFPVSIPPVLTGAVDAIFAGWFAWRSRAIRGPRWWGMFAALGMAAGMAVSVVTPKAADTVAPTVVQQVVTTLAASPLPAIGERLLPSVASGRQNSRTIIVHRSSCAHCQEHVTILRMTLPSMANWLRSHVQVELDDGQITTLNGNPTPEAEVLKPLIDRARFWPVPIIITMVDGVVVSVEDRSAHR